MGKKESLVTNIQHFQPGVFFLQETKVSRKGQIAVENYEIFEVVRPNCPTGGSILTGVHKNLHPVFISGGEDESEILVVQAKIGNYNCRFINGYGPQEYDKLEERINFYARLPLFHYISSKPVVMLQHIPTLYLRGVFSVTLDRHMP